jgi:hypothetical protein
LTKNITISGSPDVSRPGKHYDFWKPSFFSAWKIIISESTAASVPGK